MLLPFSMLILLERRDVRAAHAGVQQTRAARCGLRGLGCHCPWPHLTGSVSTTFLTRWTLRPATPPQAAFPALASGHLGDTTLPDPALHVQAALGGRKRHMVWESL